MHEAVNRECLAARNAVGILDATTLGKIDIKGADAGLFLDRVYTNGFRKLGVGRKRGDPKSDRPTNTPPNRSLT